MYLDYQRLGSVAKVGKLYGRTRQAIWEILKAHKLQLRAKRFLEKVIHRGVAYTLHKGYLRQTYGARQALHHVVWIEANGPIPEGHNIRFRDGNCRHCSLENLHCAPIQEISSITASGENQHTKARQARRLTELGSVLRGMAVNLARRHCRHAIDPEDLLQAGRIAIVEADQRYDRTKGIPFRPFAIQRAKWAMLSFIKDHATNVRAPADKFYSGVVREFSINAPVGNEEGGATYEDLFLGQDETVAEDADKTAMRLTLAKTLARLPARERSMLHAYYFEQKTLEQIGDAEGVTREAVRQRLQRILARLKRSRKLKRLNREMAA